MNSEGSWKSAYGADGFAVAKDSNNYPPYAQVSINSQFSGAWSSSTNDARALQKAASADRIASFWGSASSFSFDVNLTDGATHQIAIYCMDWDSTLRNQRIDVLDAVSGLLLDSRTIANFNTGQYVVWNIAGHLTFRITLLGGANTVVSGIFFGGTLVKANFATQDFTTQGTWKGVYGKDGFAIPNESTNYPSYSQVNISSQFSGAWTSSTNDIRALQKSAAPDRIAPFWGAWSSFTMDVNLIDGASHQIALYFLDWDSCIRSEKIDVIDAASGAILDSRTVSGFNAGQYVMWSVVGHVTFRVTLLGGVNAVVSGLFFR